jgi:hypothetical protein
MDIRYKILIYCLFASFCIFFTSCKEDRCLKNTGNIVTERREIEPFNKIQVDSYLQVEIVPDSVYFIEIIGGKNLLKHTQTEIIDSTLIIRDENMCHWLRNFNKERKVKIHTKKLTEIIQNSSSEIIFTDTLHTIQLSIEQLGSGKIDLKINCLALDLIIDSNSDLILAGKINTMTANIRYISKITANAATINTLFMEYASELNCEMNVDKELGINIYSVGNITINGNPEILYKNEYNKGRLTLN